MHLSTLLLFPAPTCSAHPGATLLHDYWAVYTPPPPTSPLYDIHHTKLVITISCEGQVTGGKFCWAIGNGIRRHRRRTPVADKKRKMGIGLYIGTASSLKGSLLTHCGRIFGLTHAPYLILRSAHSTCRPGTRRRRRRTVAAEQTKSGSGYNRG